MTATLINGKKIAQEIKEQLKAEVIELTRVGQQPGLAVILVGNDPASEVYVRNKHKTCQELGIKSEVIQMPATAREEEVLQKINDQNGDKSIHGILLQLPLPGHLNKQALTLAIDPQKDVDCFHPNNFGLLALGEHTLPPCTPAGIIELLKRTGIEIAGKLCVVIGRSNLVGKPVSLLLQKENATVVMCHSKTQKLAELCQQADILISAVGKKHTVTAEMVKPGAVVIDVGTNREEDGKLVGDVDFEKIKDIAGYITPVPGGVGPMTIAMLMSNVVAAVRSN